ncbi:MAG: cell division protein FtsQ/DivIB [Thiotrichales bacterium]|nr:cell division protein FtsQ/DivIB [Thiotrichales bacterium]
MTNSSEHPLERPLKEGSKLPKVAFWLLISTLAVVFIAWLWLPQKVGENWFAKSIDHYQLQAVLNEVEKEDVDRVLQPYLGRSFWDLPIEEVQVRLTQLDWVAQAEVTRVWPDKLAVHLLEQKPVARWGLGGLINQQGQVFFPYNLDAYRDLIVLDGDLQDSKAVLQRWVELSPLFAEQQIPLKGLASLPGKVWQISLLNGQEIRVEDADWQGQLQRFFQVYPQIPEALRNSAQSFDLRYSNGFVIGKKTP